jgi:uncharacterized protein (TIGR03435 family)
MAGPAALLVCVAASQPGKPLSFEVASIKPATPLMSGHSRGMQPGIDRLDFGYVTLRNCIVWAYRIKDFQLSAPAWMDDTRYDIVAKGPAGTRPEQLPEMLQTLLAERFMLQIHRDTKEFSGFALVVGKNGPKFDEVAQEPKDPNGIALPPLAPGQIRFSTLPGGGSRIMGTMTMQGLASLVSMQLGRPVVDMTEIAGDREITLDFSALDTHGGGMMRVKYPPPVESDPGVSVFKSIQTLGLKLESRKLPAEVIVVDHAEKMPTGN